MIKSELIENIIEMTIEGEKFESQLMSQVELLSENKFEHTNVGLYVYFKPENGIEEYRLSEIQLKNMFGDFNQELTKFELINDSKKILADVSVHFSEGIIECVEIWNKLGVYPKTELLTYQLKRI